jgi:hypothetical protein
MVDGRAPSSVVVKSSDVVEQIGACLVSGSKHLVGCPFGLERGEKGIDGYIVPGVAETAHADDDLVDRQAKELVANVLAAVARVLLQRPPLPRR